MQPWPLSLWGFIVFGHEISVAPVRVHPRKLLHHPLQVHQLVVAVVGDQVLILGSGLEDVTGDLLGVSWVGSSLGSMVRVAVSMVGHLVARLFHMGSSSSFLGALSVVVRTTSGEIAHCWLRGPPPPLLSLLDSLQLEALVVVPRAVLRSEVALSGEVVSVDVP